MAKMKLRATVFEALDNAVKNGYGGVRTTSQTPGLMPRTAAEQLRQAWELLDPSR